MANNCLITKLKQAVSNSNLPVLGRMRITPYEDVPAGESRKLTLTFSENCVVNFINCTYNGQTSTVIGTSPVNLASGLILGEDAYIEIDKYKVTSINSVFFNINVKELDYVNYLASLVVSYAANGDITKVASKAGYSSSYPGSFNIYSGEVTGDISGFGLGGYLASVRLPAQPSDIEGNITNLANTAATLTSVEFPYSKKITFDIIDFVKRARKEGVTTKDSNITFTGTHQINTTVGPTVISDTSVYLTWTPTTITYNGTTIENSEVEP